MPESFFLPALRAFAVMLLLFSSSVFSGQSPTGCEDLSAFPVTRNVDFEREIQPIFSQCSGCHGENGQAGLDLRPGKAYGNLVGVESTTWPERLRVSAGEPFRSVLFNAVNCSDPYGPRFQMGNVTGTDRALIRDWIAGGAQADAAAVAVPVLDSSGRWLMFFLLGLAGLIAMRLR